MHEPRMVATSKTRGTIRVRYIPRPAIVTDNDTSFACVPFTKVGTSESCLSRGARVTATTD